MARPIEVLRFPNADAPERIARGEVDVAPRANAEKYVKITERDAGVHERAATKVTDAGTH